MIRNLAKRAALTLARWVYASAEVSRTNASWRGRLPGQPNAWLQGDSAKLRARMEQLFRDTPTGRALIGASVTQMLPAPIEMRPNVTINGTKTPKTEQFNRQALALWRLFCSDRLAFSLDGMTTYEIQMDVIARQIGLAGECAIVAHQRRQQNPRLPGVRFELVQADRLEGTRTTGPRPIGGGTVNRPGIVYDADGRATAYRFYTREGSVDAVEYPASMVCHVLRTLYPGQQYGESMAAGVGELNHSFGRYFRSEVKGQEVAARIGLVTEGDADILALLDDAQKTARGIDTELQVAELDDMTVLRLQPGEKIGQIAQQRPGGGFSAFCDWCLSLMGASEGIPKERLTGDYSKTNFTSGKLSGMASDAQVAPKRWTLRDFAARFYYEKFVEQCLLEGKLRPVNGLSAREHFACRYQLPVTPMIDEEKQVKADRDELAGGLATWTSKLAKRGQTPEEYLQERETERQLLARYSDLGLDPYAEADTGTLGGQPSEPPPGAPPADDLDPQDGDT